jgi:hypothetical protein
MNTRRAFLLSLCMGGLAACVAAPPRRRAAVRVRVAPPPPRVIAVPAPRHGYVWAPGYWRWHGRRHVWVDGHWLRARQGWRWAPAHWQRHSGGEWHFVDGRWHR